MIRPALWRTLQSGSGIGPFGLIRRSFTHSYCFTGKLNHLLNPFPIADSSMTLPLAKADCLIIREPHAPAAAAAVAARS